MANEVKILISAVDKASGTLNKIQGELKQTGQTGTAGFLGMGKSALAAVGGIAAVGTAVSAAANFVRSSVNDWANYNEEIRKMSIATSAAPEDLSRMMQAADDLGVSMDSLYTSLRIVAKQGVQPTIDNIANLSDKLLAIKDPTERAAEAARLFGRNWSEIAPFVLAGGDAIREGTAAIDDSLVATQKSIDQSREYKVAVDNLSDSWTGLRNVLASEAMPAMTGVLDSLYSVTSAALDSDNVLTNFFASVATGGATMEEAAFVMGAYVTGMINGSQASDIFRQAVGQATAVLPDMNEQLRQAAEAQTVLGDETEQTGQAIAASGNLLGYANEALSSYVENTALAKEAQDALDVVTGKLSLTEIELRDKIQAVTMAMSQGLLTPHQWADAMAIMADETINAADKVSVLRSLIQSLKSKEITITVNYEYTGKTAAGAAGINVPGVTGNAGGGENKNPAGNPGGNNTIIEPGKASGGSVYANRFYPVGERGPELFMPSTPGTIIPNDKIGAMGTQINNTFIIYQQPDQSASAVADQLVYMMQRAQAGKQAGLKYAGR